MALQQTISKLKERLATQKMEMARRKAIRDSERAEERDLYKRIKAEEGMRINEEKRGARLQRVEESARIDARAGRYGFLKAGGAALREKIREKMRRPKISIRRKKQPSRKQGSMAGGMFGSGSMDMFSGGANMDMFDMGKRKKGRRNPYGFGSGSMDMFGMGKRKKRKGIKLF